MTHIDSWTPLHHAAINGQSYVVEYLLSLDNIDVVSNWSGDFCVRLKKPLDIFSSMPRTLPLSYTTVCYICLLPPQAL